MKAIVGSALLVTASLTQAEVAPVIDMHFHAMAYDEEGPPPSFVCAPYDNWPIRDPGKSIGDYMKDFTVDPPCRNRIPTPRSDEELMRRNLAVLERHNVTAVTSGDADQVERMRRAAPSRIVPALHFGESDWPSIEQLRALHKAGRLRVMGEIVSQYGGTAPDSPRLEPYYALAEELDIPVAIHIGPGPPGVPYFASPKYRMAMSNPLALEDVLLRHPKMRLYVMHAGWPMGDEMVGLMFTHPQVYVDVAVIDFAWPRAEFHAYLRRLVDAGMAKRIMFGSDQMVWPEAMDTAIANIESALFLSAEQKRDILYNNAARFLRLEK